MSAVDTALAGRWALILGGSDGLGAAFADDLARRGAHCLLVARNAGKLDAAAQGIASRHRVSVKTLALDLGEADAVDRLAAATAGLDLGLIVFNAGAEASGQLFIDAPMAQWRTVIDRNIGFLTGALHHFSQRFVAQGSGALLIVGSEAAFGGAARGALYTASKAYALNLGESLWAELKPLGIAVQSLVFKIADTPTLREVLARKGIPVEATGAIAPEPLARATIDALFDGPVFNFDEAADGELSTTAAGRRARVIDVSTQLEAFYKP
jgi:short-subunit dehydrogenase